MTQQVVYQSPNGTPFPVDWAHIDLARDQWSWDQVHNPTPLTPLAQDLITVKRQGMYRGGHVTGRPFHEERMYANGYGFSRRLKVDPESAEKYQGLAARDSEERSDRLVDLWESSYLPETEALTRQIQEWAAPNDSLLDLLSRYDQIEIAWRRCGELHTLSTGLAGVVMRQFDEFCRNKFGDEGTRIAVESISGMPNMSVKSAVALWELSREAVNRPSVADLLRSHSTQEFLANLDEVAEGPVFRCQLTEFLETWGQRNESYYEVGYLTWREDPDVVVSIIRTYIDVAEDQNPSVLHKRAVASRIARTEDVESRLSDPTVLGEFLIGQRRARQHTVLMEDHNYFIDQRAYTSLRSPHQAIGTLLLEAGALDDTDDIFYLHINEIKEHANHPGRKYQSLITQRREDRQKWMHVLPPSVIGGDATLATPPLAGESKPVRIATIQGLAASAGAVTGIARLILSLGEASRLSPGDILVTYATAPPWTPLFAIAGGVVTDAGGPLAHCAVVAREYGIPAVVGATKATSTIKDGMTISVNGTTGLVTILN